MEESSSRRIRIKLHGALATRFGPEFFVLAETAYDAIRALAHQHPDLQNVPFEDRPSIQIVGHPNKQSLNLPIVGEELHILPSFWGSKSSGGLIQIVVGAVLIAASLAFPPAGLIATTLVGLGASMVLGGVLQFLSPAPNRDSGIEGATDPDASKYLGATINTTRIGTRIPILYGKFRVGGHYISFDVQAKDVAV